VISLSFTGDWSKRGTTVTRSAPLVVVDRSRH
jgi:hypothetical protein